MHIVGYIPTFVDRYRKVNSGSKNTESVTMKDELIYTYEISSTFIKSK